jgi:hypothetical protein
MNEQQLRTALWRRAILSVLVGVVVLMTADCIISSPRVGPPALIAEVVIVSPGPGHVWVAGYWGWSVGRYHWVPGHWVKARPGRAWVPGRWEQRGHRWVWRRGHWK